jgi:hypothetical protein
MFKLRLNLETAHIYDISNNNNSNNEGEGEEMAQHPVEAEDKVGEVEEG